MEQWLFSVFSIVSGMIGLGYGSYPPVTWGEALVWVFAMLTTATFFSVLNGFVIATILSSASSRHRYKEKMDMIMVGRVLLTSPTQCATTVCCCAPHLSMNLCTCEQVK